MPKIVYGIMTFHRSHKIESPNPTYELNNDKPNACAACHIDKTDEWIVEKTNKLWKNNTISNLAKKQQEIIQSIYKLHSGDPAERGIAAKNLAYASELLSAKDKLFIIPHLLFAMEDNYPAIRRFSFKSLKPILNKLAIESGEFAKMAKDVEAFDFIADNSLRTRIVRKAWNNFNVIDKSNWQTPPQGSFLNNTYQLNIDALMELRKMARQESKAIEIGE